MAVIDVGPVLAGSDLPVPFMAADGTTPVNNAKQIRRNLLAALLTSGSAEQTVRDGVLPKLWGTGAEGAKWTSLSLLQGASPAQYVVPFPGTAVISRSGQGPYLIMQTTSPQIPLDLADGTNPRYDVVYIRLYDKKLGDLTYHGFQWCVIKGNPAASPAVPSLPAVDGVMAIAAILRPANVNTVANSQITDLRKGTSLDGSARPMLPGDLLTDAGGRNGERRVRVTPSALVALGAPPLLYDYWDAPGGTWRGTQSFDIDMRSTNGGSITNGGSRAMGSVTVPDPGWPYRVAAGGSVRGSGMSTSAAAHTATLQYRVGVSTPATINTTDLCGVGTCADISSGGNGYWGAPIEAASGSFTGSKTVYKIVGNNTGAAFTAVGSDEVYDKTTIRISPA